jgi:hypothetical protein
MNSPHSNAASPASGTDGSRTYPLSDQAGLEVAQNHKFVPPQMAQQQQAYMAQQPPMTEYYYGPGMKAFTPVGTQYAPSTVPPPNEPPAEKTIMGMRRTTFILAVLLALVIVIAAVGGGVGGTLAVQNAKK